MAVMAANFLLLKIIVLLHARSLTLTSFSPRQSKLTSRSKPIIYTKTYRSSISVNKDTDCLAPKQAIHHPLKLTVSHRLLESCPTQLYAQRVCLTSVKVVVRCSD
jgi:hypothetical protein